jgi:hypothetical protein
LLTTLLAQAVPLRMPLALRLWNSRRQMSLLLLLLLLLLLRGVMMID